MTLIEESDTLAAVRAQLKQFFDEKKAAGEHAFREAHVCEFEESFDENYDVVWIIYYWSDRDEVVSAVNAFLQETGTTFLVLYNIIPDYIVMRFN